MGGWVDDRWVGVKSGGIITKDFGGVGLHWSPSTSDPTEHCVDVLSSTLMEASVYFHGNVRIFPWKFPSNSTDLKSTSSMKVYGSFHQRL